MGRADGRGPLAHWTGDTDMGDAGENLFYAEVSEGPDAGRRIEFRAGTTTLGRSSDNDVTLLDPVLSRHHCRFECSGAALKVVDLESANGTILNGMEVRESLVRPGDTIQIGDTVLKISAGAAEASVAAPEVLITIDTPPSPPPGDAAPAAPPPPPPQPAKPEGGETAAATPVVDLGFGDEEGAKDGKKPNWRPMIWGLAGVAVLAAAASMILRAPDEDVQPAIARPAEPTLLPLEIEYEKVEADNASIFRYHMSLDATGHLSIEIDDLAENRHVRKDSVVSSNSLARLAKQIDGSGLARLGEIPAGIASGASLVVKDLTVVLNRRVVQAKVENRMEPAEFESAREAIETFGKNELGIWAIQYPRERLVEMAEEAFTRARNLYDQRGIAHGNIFMALKSCREAEFYLETVEPKPDFYAETVTLHSEAEEELARRYEDQRFKADRAINLKDWQIAAEELRILRDQIPDDDDPRNIDATRKLLDVENRIKKGDK